MARRRISRHVQNAAQLVLGFVVPAFLIVAFVFFLQRRASRSSSAASNAFYLAVSNAVVSNISRTNQLRLIPLMDMQFRKTGDVTYCVGWVDSGPDFSRTWFQIKVLNEGQPPQLAEVEFFDQKPASRF